eukprot:scaffold170769_cov28-Tisochrysis_lutea.AAC.1
MEVASEAPEVHITAESADTAISPPSPSSSTPPPPPLAPMPPAPAPPTPQAAHEVLPKPPTLLLAPPVEALGASISAPSAEGSAGLGVYHTNTERSLPGCIVSSSIARPPPLREEVRRRPPPTSLLEAAPLASCRPLPPSSDPHDTPSPVAVLHSPSEPRRRAPVPSPPEENSSSSTSQEATVTVGTAAVRLGREDRRAPWSHRCYTCARAGENAGKSVR